MNQDIWKGIAAGAIAGLVGTAVMAIWEEVAPSQPENVAPPSEELADRVKEETAGESLTKADKPLVKSLNFVFGTGIGALYGGVMEVYPNVPTAKGTALGMAMYGATHGSILPMLNAEPWPIYKPMKFLSGQFSGHILYGLTVEVTRRVVRNWFDGKSKDLLSTT